MNKSYAHLFVNASINLEYICLSHAVLFDLARKNSIVIASEGTASSLFPMVIVCHCDRRALPYDPTLDGQ